MPPARSQPPRDDSGTIVTGIDGSENSWRAFHYALGLARRQRSRIIVVFVRTTPWGAADIDVAAGIYHASAESAYHASAEPAAELPQAVSQLATEWGVPTTYVCATGDPVAALMKIADQNHADALVIGSSRGFLHRFAGSKSVRANAPQPLPGHHSSLTSASSGGVLEAPWTTLRP
jgi:nucleotide-binding universal stress UspA family protein